jgi:endonuclease/exonuclease/phosphatase family metal-dependent hydrolase
VLIRTWNLFHGNAKPPQRRAFLDEMIELATVDEPDVLCVQEVPAWALGRFTVGDVAARPTLGPFPIPRELGRILTAQHHGLFRSAFGGQGNAIMLSPALRVLSHHVLTLNTRRFRAAQARWLGLNAIARLAWAKERRVVQGVRVAAPDGRTLFIANTHMTAYAHDQRLADAELLRAAWFAVSAARPEDVVVLAGDFNVPYMRSRTLHDLASPVWGFSQAGPGIDHVLVRGASAGAPYRWPDDRRERGGVLLSDHSPVDVEIEFD